MSSCCSTGGYGIDFSGATRETQAASLASFLEGKTAITDKFDISVDGTAVKLTSKVEGNDPSKVGTIKDSHPDYIRPAPGVLRRRISLSGAGLPFKLLQVQLANQFAAVMSCREGVSGNRDELFRLLVEVGMVLLHSRMSQNRLRDEFFQNDSATLAHMAVLLCGT